MVPLPLFPEVAKIVDRLAALDAQIAASPTPALQAARADLIALWRNVFARSVGVLLAHEMLHVLLGTLDSLPRPNATTQAQIALWFPVPPAAPFG